MPRDLLTDLGLDIFASPDTTKIYMGKTRYWVEFKNELDYGERKMLDGAAIRGYEREMAEQGRDVDTSSNKLMFVTQLDRVAPLRLAVWIADWYIVTKRPDGEMSNLELPVRLEERVGLFRRMRESFAQQLVDMLDKHEEQMRKEREVADVAAGILEKQPQPEVDDDPNPTSGSATPAGEPAGGPLTRVSAFELGGPSPS
jgi:hypothetical protein